MITLTQLEAEIDTYLTSKELRVLTLLVKASPDYNQAIGKWPVLEDTLAVYADSDATYDDTQKSKIQALRAVLTQLGTLPAIVVESNGNQNASSYFSTQQNWRELALTVLDTLYDLPIILGQQSYVLVQRRVHDIKLRDSAISRIRY